MVGQSCRDGDQLVADGGRGRLRVEQRGQGAGGAGEVERPGRRHRPRTVRGKRPCRKVGRRARSEIGVHLFLTAWARWLVSASSMESGGVGEHRVVAGGGEQLTL